MTLGLMRCSFRTSSRQLKLPLRWVGLKACQRRLVTQYKTAAPGIQLRMSLLNHTVLSLTVVPEALRIYHAGTGRIVFVGCLKLTTIAIFATSLTFIAMNAYEEGSNLTLATSMCEMIHLIHVIVKS